MKLGVSALIVGLLFGFGLGVGGMTQPQKVLGFLDVFGSWDPTLIFVMIGAIAIHAIAYRVVRRRASPLLADAFHIPATRHLDWKLITGAAIFGVGWGIAGYCPGPAIAALVTLRSDVLVFVLAMVVGMVVQSKLETKLNISK